MEDVDNRQLSGYLESESCCGQDGVEDSQPWDRRVVVTDGLVGGVARHPLVLLEASLRGLKEKMIRDGCWSSMEAFSDGPTTEDTLMTTALAEEFWYTVNG